MDRQNLPASIGEFPQSEASRNNKSSLARIKMALFLVEIMVDQRFDIRKHYALKDLHTQFHNVNINEALRTKRSQVGAVEGDYPHTF